MSPEELDFNGNFEDLETPLHDPEAPHEPCPSALNPRPLPTCDPDSDTEHYFASLTSDLLGDSPKGSDDHCPPPPLLRHSTLHEQLQIFKKSIQVPSSVASRCSNVLVGAPRGECGLGPQVKAAATAGPVPLPLAVRTPLVCFCSFLTRA